MSAHALSLNPRLWILGPKRDLSLFVLSPLWIFPLIWMVRSHFDVNNLGAVVLAIGGVGHHLPGFIRAYTDPVLFRRYRSRFIAAPIFFLGVCAVFSGLHLHSLSLILILWGMWHGAMQVNGFLRIYDAKAGSISTATARLDWAMCLAWFGGGLLHSSNRLIALLYYFYGAGGALIAPEAFFLFRQVWDVFTVLITLLFFINVWKQVRAGQAPNPLKFLTMASSFAFWWFAMVGVENLLVGLVLFEMFHDVQYNALVWVYNQRRVSQGMTASPLERLLFQPRVWRVAFYALLILAYGYLGVVMGYSSVQAPDASKAGAAAANFWTGMFAASAFLHFYFDGFIWRVREAQFRQELGLEKKSRGSSGPQPVSSRWAPGWKWAFFAVPALLLGTVELHGSVSPALSQYRNMARIAPNRWPIHFALALLEKSYGNYDAAAAQCEQSLEIDPDAQVAHALLGDIYFHQGRQDLALGHYLRAASLDSTDYEVRDHLATLLLMQDRVAEAIPHLYAVIGRKPEDANLHYLLGSALMHEGRVQEAVPYLRRTLELDPRYSDAAKYLAQAESLLSGRK